MNDDKATWRITAAAERGAQWLDVVFPGWHEHIDTESLQMLSLDNCVGAQVTKWQGWPPSWRHQSPYDTFAKRMRLDIAGSMRLGFSLRTIENSWLTPTEQWSLLTTAWHHQITARS